MHDQVEAHPRQDSQPEPLRRPVHDRVADELKQNRHREQYLAVLWPRTIRANSPGRSTCSCPTKLVGATATDPHRLRRRARARLGRCPSRGAGPQRRFGDIRRLTPGRVQQSTVVADHHHLPAPPRRHEWTKPSGTGSGSTFSSPNQHREPARLSPTFHVLAQPAEQLQHLSRSDDEDHADVQGPERRRITDYSRPRPLGPSA